MHSHHHTLLQKQDLTKMPNHAIALMGQRLVDKLSAVYPNITLQEGPKIVSAHENYDVLGYNKNDITQSDVYTKWVSDTHVLRTQTTSLVVEGLRQNAHLKQSLTLIAQGMVYRRDVRDRIHCGEPHQMDVWVVHPKTIYHPLKQLVGIILEEISPLWRWHNTSHPYTQQGKEVEVLWQNQYLELLECGIIDPQVLEKTGWCSDTWTGLALGLGLDRAVMVKKGLPDIRLLRSPHTQTQAQMNDLSPWKEVSRHPSINRQLSIMLKAKHTEEELTEMVLNGTAQPELVEKVKIFSLKSPNNVWAQQKATMCL